jgi:hypothetical protein
LNHTSGASGAPGVSLPRTGGKAASRWHCLGLYLGSTLAEAQRVLGALGASLRHHSARTRSIISAPKSM